MAVENKTQLPNQPGTIFRFYVLRQNSGTLFCYDASTGDVLYGGEMLDGLGIVYNSPVFAGGKVYVLGGSGLTYVLNEGSELDILSKNKLDDSFTSSPAIAGDEIFLRGLKYLYCIAHD